MAMNNMKSNQQILPRLTTQRTKENEENILLSLTDQLKAWEDKFHPHSQMRKLHL